MDVKINLYGYFYNVIYFEHIFLKAVTELYITL